MTAFKEQYSKEIHNQEIKSNKRTLKGFMWLFGLLFLIWLFTMEGLFVVDERVIIRTKLEKPSKIKGLALI